MQFPLPFSDGRPAVTAPAWDRPMDEKGWLALAGRAGLLAVLFYLFALAVVAAEAAALCALAVVTIGAARFGMHRPVLDLAKRVERMIRLVLSSLWLSRGSDRDLPLLREEAPRLYAMLERVSARLEMAPPDEVALMMANNAAVRLRGYGTGRGRCRLYLGFDLLAVLSEAEVEAVLAHEMAHARLIQRGFKGVLASAVARMSRLAGALGEVLGEAQARRTRSHLAEALHRPARWFARTGNRLLAAYARQDEFAADRAAAEVCGAGTYRSALVRIHVADRKESSLAWRDRVVQAQRDGRFSEWVRRQLTPETPGQRAELEREARSERARSDYDFHPPLADRLAALPGDGDGPLGEAESMGTALLADADALATRLIDHIEEGAAEEERKESARLERAVRKQKLTGVSLGWTVLAWVFFGIAAFLGAWLAWILLGLQPGYSARPADVWIPAAVAVPGAGILVLLRRRERSVLPAPPFALWKAAMDERRPDPEIDYLHARIRGLEPRRRDRHTRSLIRTGIAGLGVPMAFSFVIGILTAPPGDVSRMTGGLAMLMVYITIGLVRLARKRSAQAPPPWAFYDAVDREQHAERAGSVEQIERALMERVFPAKGRRVVQAWKEECWGALARCEYKRALVAASRLLEAAPNCREGMMAHIVAGAYCGGGRTFAEAAEALRKLHGPRPSVSWALGWALAMVGDWTSAEAYLLNSASHFPDRATAWALLGLCQWRRGKLREALASLRRARDLEPHACEHRIQLVGALIGMGRARDAERELEALAGHGTDFDVMHARLQVAVALARWEEASRRAAALEEVHPGAKTWLAIARAYGTADQLERACEYLERVTAAGFYPEALLGLAQAALLRKEASKCRAYLAEALDVTRELPEGAETPLRLLGRICQALLSLGEPAESCQGWLAHVDMARSPAKVRRLDLLIFAPTQGLAQHQVAWLYETMHPGQQLTPEQVRWEPAPPNQQPEGRVTPGVYGHHVG